MTKDNAPACEHCGDPVPVRQGPRRFCKKECRVAASRWCRFPPCENTARRTGLCLGHADQHDAGQELTLLRYDKGVRRYGAASRRDDEGRKECGCCRQWLPITEFQSHANTADRLAFRCRSCTREYLISRKFNIPVEQYRAMLAAQNGCCAICKEPPRDGGRELAVDHDHSCCPSQESCGKCVRALLCGPCNAALGLMRDSADLLLEAAAYLKSF